MQSATTPQEDSMYSIEDFSEGQRVEIHPATDLWMRGARYGVVVKVGLMSVHVRLDATGKTIGIRPRSIGEIV
jgi:hypothetical protein